MAISEQAKEITERIYQAYGSGTGVLFGIPPAQKASVEAIVQATITFQEEVINAEDKV